MKEITLSSQLHLVDSHITKIDVMSPPTTSAKDTK